MMTKLSYVFFYVWDIQLILFIGLKGLSPVESNDAWERSSCLATTIYVIFLF